jgi:UDP-glucose 4-epimerase
MRTAVVTGGAGFIGSHLARRLVSEGWKVIVIDNLSTGFKENIPPEAEFISADISDKGFIANLKPVRCDVIFHLAAQSSGEISFDDPVYDLNTNCMSTILLLDWCRKNGVKRFIYTSSMSIYGDQEVQPVAETAVPHPKSFYGAGKLASEAYISIYSKMGLDTTSLRLFNVYGPGQNMGNMRQGMVSIYMAYLLDRKELHVKGSADRYRDIIYIDDVINAYMKCIDRTETFGKSYNIATGRKTTVGELVSGLLKAFGYDKSGYPVRYSGSTPGDTFGIYADIGSFMHDTGWKPSVKLEDGIKIMVEWARGRAGR